MIINESIDNGKPFDWGNASKDYAKYRDIYPAEFYEKIIGLGLCISGQTVLDLGTGTGVIPRNMYSYGAKFTGVDISENQIVEARRLSAESGMDIKYMVSSAENIDFPDFSFDVITACQCFMYFDQSILVPKIKKILKENGHFCILFMAWLPEESKIASKSEELVLKYNPAWTGGGIKRFPIEVSELCQKHFEVENSIAYTVNINFTRESWNGRIKACRGIGASSLTKEKLAEFENEHLAYLNSAQHPFSIPHYVTVLNLRKPTSKVV